MRHRDVDELARSVGAASRYELVNVVIERTRALQSGVPAQVLGVDAGGSDVITAFDEIAAGEVRIAGRVPALEKDEYNDAAMVVSSRQVGFGEPRSARA